MKNSWLCASILVLAAATSALAWPGGDKGAAASPAPAGPTVKAAEQQDFKGGRRYVLQVPDKKTEKEMLELFQAKKMLSEDLAVLARLEKQRKGKLDVLAQALQTQFAVEPDIRYAFDARENSIYALTFPKGGTNAPERTLYKKLAKPEEGTRFVNLMRSRDNAVTEAQVFAVVGREKLAELKKVDDLLAKKFNMTPGHLYNYDDKTMTLYEIQPASKAAGQ